jgi:hypothetical protein
LLEILRKLSGRAGINSRRFFSSVTALTLPSGRDRHVDDRPQPRTGALKWSAPHLNPQLSSSERSVLVLRPTDPSLLYSATNNDAMNMAITPLLTLAAIAARLNVDLHRVTYAVRKFGILETQRAGVIRLFREEQVREISRAVEATSRTLISSRSRGCRVASGATTTRTAVGEGCSDECR